MERFDPRGRALELLAFDLQNPEGWVPKAGANVREPCRAHQRQAGRDGETVTVPLNTGRAMMTSSRNSDQYRNVDCIVKSCIHKDLESGRNPLNVRRVILTLSWTATVTGPQRSSLWRKELEPFFFFKIWH
ncbi:hypothetical protein EYF80_026148 [Liparis tanakae]|uniref:Uncharacterized protein n=1 Tax=Liparis tanakae TaxID=230148 RepID=A0A4Z2HFN2_9TELE|nr:hypothetical protein EYF80_026148 [Liparis tanakae]